jgi:hypothetical protein
VLVLLVAAHSAAVGVALGLFPEWTTAFAGFGPVRPIFFARQAGVFHLVLAAGYLIELGRGSVRLLVTAKSIAAVFLVASWLGGVPGWSVPLSAAGDALMALAVAWLARAERAPPRG